MASLYRTEAPGDWGVMQAPPGGEVGTAQLATEERPTIFYRYWRVGAPQTLLLMHGLGAHSGWFIDMGNALAHLGINVYALDHQGFGRSEGVRGHVVRWQTFITDIDHMVDQIKQDVPNGKVFMLGHSMGGVFATQYAAAHQAKLGGVILLNPWIADTAKVSPLRALSILFGGLFGSAQTVHFPDTRSTASMTSHPAAGEFLLNDTYWVYARTKGFYWQITQMRGNTLASAAKVTIPALVLQAGRDQAVVPAATRKAYDKLASRDKTYIDYPDYEHDSEFEPDRSKLDNDLISWVKAH